MSKSTSLGKETVLLTFSKMATLAISTLTSMMLARFRSFEEYGTYSQLTLVISLFTAIFMLGLPNSINYFLARANSRAEQQTTPSAPFSVCSWVSHWPLPHL